MDSAMKVDVYLDPNNFNEDAILLVRRARPNWIAANIKLKVYSNGITNKMLGYYQLGDESDIVLVRINGNKTEIFLDRQNEIESFLKLHSAGCAPKLYFTFKNGLCYEYIPGNTVTRDEVRSPEVFSLIAKEMARLHKISDTKLTQKEPICFALSRKFLDLRFSECSPPGRGMENYDGPSESVLRDELRVLEQHLSKLSSPLVYCHNDLLLNNIIFNKTKGSVQFIDYEYTGVNYQAFDIGNHFCEFAGVNDVDYSYYPNRPLQLMWLREYLKHWKSEQDISDAEVEELYIKVNKFSLASHLLWAIWAIVQAKYSAIDFDYLKYAKERMEEYFKRKEDLLSL